MGRWDCVEASVVVQGAMDSGEVGLRYVYGFALATHVFHWTLIPQHPSTRVSTRANRATHSIGSNRQPLSLLILFGLRLDIVPVPYKTEGIGVRVDEQVEELCGHLTICSGPSCRSWKTLEDVATHPVVDNRYRIQVRLCRPREIADLHKCP
jgi:hypothetical protein